MQIPAFAAPLVTPSGASLKNRLIKAATSENLATLEGAPTPALIEAHRRWAAGGVAAIITGNVIIDPNGRESPRNVVVTDERHLRELRAWADAIHAEGAAVWMQLNHAGRQASRRTTASPVAPSAIKLAGFGPLVAKPRALESREVSQLVESFAEAARVAANAGFDGVEIHAAHGYLISQFLSPRTNVRDDQWGGDPVRRRRFLLEIATRTRAAIGPDRVLAVKLNSADFQRGGFAESDALDVARALDATGVVDVIEVSGGNYESPAMMGDRDRRRESTRRREAYFAEFAATTAAAIDTPILLTGGLRSAEAMNAVIAEGAASLVGLARPLIVEPDLPAALLSGAAERATPIDLAIGIRKLDSMIEALWYGRQLERLAAGLTPRLRGGRLAAVLRGFWRNNRPTHFRRRRALAVAA